MRTVGALIAISAISAESDISTLKATTDYLQCGTGSYCRCDAPVPTCHITEKACTCFADDPDLTVRSWLNQVAKDELSSARIDRDLRLRLLGLRYSPITDSELFRIINRIQALRNVDAEREVFYNKLQEMINAFEDTKAMNAAGNVGVEQMTEQEYEAFKHEIAQMIEKFTVANDKRGMVEQAVNYAVVEGEQKAPSSVESVPSEEYEEVMKSSEATVDPAQLQAIRDEFAANIEDVTKDIHNNKAMIENLAKLVETYEALKVAEGDVPEADTSEPESYVPAKRASNEEVLNKLAEMIEAFDEVKESGALPSSRRLQFVRSTTVLTPIQRAVLMAPEVLGPNYVRGIPSTFDLSPWRTNKWIAPFGHLRYRTFAPLGSVYRCYAGICGNYYA